MSGALITQDWQMEYRGTLIGEGSPFSIVEVSGLLNLPDIRTADRARLRRHGMAPGDDFAGGRSVGVVLEVYGNDAADFAAASEALLRLTSPGQDEQGLYFRIPGVAGGGTRFLRARPRRRAVPIGREFMYRIPVVTLEFAATDPRLYDATESVGVSTLPTAGGGLSFPATFPMTFGAVSTGGSITAVNAGTFPTSPTFRIDGPVTNPRIENVTTGESLAFAITLGAGEWLEVDTEYRTVLLGGTASRYSTLVSGSTWWDLDPGTSEVTFRASTTTAATLTMTWASAWV